MKKLGAGEMQMQCQVRVTYVMGDIKAWGIRGVARRMTFRATSRIKNPSVSKKFFHVSCPPAALSLQMLRARTPPRAAPPSLIGSHQYGACAASDPRSLKIQRIGWFPKISQKFPSGKNRLNKHDSVSTRVDPMFRFDDGEANQAQAARTKAWVRELRSTANRMRPVR